MKTPRVLRVALAVAIAASATVLPVSASYADANPGVIDTGGGATGGQMTKVVDPGKGGTPVVCKNGKGSWLGNNDYYIDPFPGCGPYSWAAVIVRCVVAYDEFRFYGTVSNPTRGATMSRVNVRDYCLPANLDNARTYFPNPKDAQSANNTIWSVRTAQSSRDVDVSLSDNCTDINNQLNTCVPTSLAPRAAIGEPCTSLMASGTLSPANALTSPTTSKELKESIRKVVYNQYRRVLSNATSVYPLDQAAALSGLQTGRPGTAQSVSSPSDITRLGNSYNCASAIQFIPATDVPVADPVQLGACISPIYIPARVYTLKNGSWPRSVGAVTSFLDGKTGWSPEQGPAPYAFALTGDWATYNDLRYSDTAPRVKNTTLRGTDPSVAVQVDVPREKYLAALKTLVKNDPGSLPDAERATKDFFPEQAIKATGFETFVWPSRVLDEAKLAVLDRTNAANSAANGSACWSMRVAASFEGPTPTTTSTSTSTSTSRSSSTPPTSSPGTTPPNTRNPSSPESGEGAPGPVQVVVTVNPKTYTVGGTSRPQSVGVTGVEVLCDGHRCGTLESDPLIVGTPQGRLSLTPTGGFDGCARTTQRECDMYISKAPTTGNIAGQSTTALFFSPSRKGEAATVVVTDEYLRVVPKKWIPPVECPRIPRPVPGPSGEPAPEVPECTPVPGYWTEDWPRAYIITQFNVRAADGGSLSRPVTGTIGK